MQSSNSFIIIFPFNLLISYRQFCNESTENNCCNRKGWNSRKESFDDLWNVFHGTICEREKEIKKKGRMEKPV
jgi:hypothetical protein